MSQLTKFFKEKKLDLKFKNLGKGHRLNESSESSATVGASSRPEMINTTLSDQVAKAALSRMEKQTVQGKVKIKKNVCYVFKYEKLLIITVKRMINIYVLFYQRS